MTGGVGFDINCGVRLLRTNLTEKDVKEASRESSLPIPASPFCVLPIHSIKRSKVLSAASPFLYNNRCKSSSRSRFSITSP